MKRRTFIKNTALTTAGLGLTAPYIRSWAGPASDEVSVAIMGCNGRGDFLAGAFTHVKGVKVKYICDVDTRALEKGINTVNKEAGYKPKGFGDIRKMLEQKDFDALVVATPDHWHTPAAIMGCEAGKHVYVEKPCCHNPGEGEWLVKAARKYNKHVQMGDQRRSHPLYLKAIKELHDGMIGRVYFARAWYANNRGPIGNGKQTAVPDWLNYELWQGPAPRRPYQDNLIHYNWHWFWHWGTSETCNNGTHEIDVMRWGLQEEFPVKVTSSGGRYRYNDDWQTPDTQVLAFDFNDKKSMMWEGRSCNGLNEEDDGRGVIFYGENGSMKLLNTRYLVYDADSKLIKEEKEKSDQPTDVVNTVGPGLQFDIHHLANFIETIRGNQKLNSEIAVGYTSTVYPLLGNIAYRTQHELTIDPSNGHILNDPEAMKYWDREYEPGWTPKV